MKTSLLIPCAICILIACATTPQAQPQVQAQPQPQAQPLPQPAKAAWRKNLKVLPDDISRDDLTRTMRIWSRSLGVECDHCHVQPPLAEPGGFSRIDFVSDAKPEKEISRVMLRMTQQLNTDTIARVARKNSVVDCNTCHRGKAVPDSTLPQSTE